MSATDNLVARLERDKFDSFANDLERVKVKDALYAALQRVQTPWETALGHCFVEPSTAACLKICVDVELFSRWLAKGPSPKTTRELALLGDVDEGLMGRILRHLAAMNHITDVDRDTYALTPFSKALGSPKFASNYNVLFDVNEPGFSNLPAFLAQASYTNPIDPSATAFSISKGAPLFDYLRQSSCATQHFQNAMANHAAAKTVWLDLYPTETIVAARKPGRALVVDVGGGQGHDIERFRARYPDVAAGSLVLQDLPEVVANAPVRLPVVAKGQSFFQDNPERGARVYYLHNILHDWPDSKAAEILHNVAAAMDRGYSRILVHEVVIAARQPHARTTMLDITMMAFFSAKERNAQMWRDLVDSAGLRIIKIHDSLEAIESIIELDLA